MNFFPKPLLKPLKKYWKGLLTDKRSRVARPLYLSYDLFLQQSGGKYYSQFGENTVYSTYWEIKKAASM